MSLFPSVRRLQGPVFIGPVITILAHILALNILWNIVPKTQPRLDFRSSSTRAKEQPGAAYIAASERGIVFMSHWRPESLVSKHYESSTDHKDSFLPSQETNPRTRWRKSSHLESLCVQLGSSQHGRKRRLVDLSGLGLSKSKQVVSPLRGYAANIGINDKRYFPRRPSGRSLCWEFVNHSFPQGSVILDFAVLLELTRSI